MIVNGGLTVNDLEKMKQDKRRLDWLEAFCGNPVRRFIDESMNFVPNSERSDRLMMWDKTTKTWYMSGPNT